MTTAKKSAKSKASESKFALSPNDLPPSPLAAKGVFDLKKSESTEYFFKAPPEDACDEKSEGDTEEETLLEDLAEEAEAEGANDSGEDGEVVPDDAAFQKIVAEEETAEDADDAGDESIDNEDTFIWPTRGEPLASTRRFSSRSSDRVGEKSGGRVGSNLNSNRITSVGDSTGDEDVESDDIDRLGDGETEASAFFAKGGDNFWEAADDGDGQSAASYFDRESSNAGGNSSSSQALVVAKSGVDADDPNRDLLREYLKEISVYPLLTREEEHELAVRYRETGDQAAAWRLVTANLRLVVKIANEYKRQTMKILDLIQEGNMGLVMGVQKFDPYRGVKLSSYAAFWIRACLLKHVIDNFRMVKVGTSQTQRKIFFNLNKELKKLEAEGFVPTTKLLADRLNVSESEVANMQMRMAAGEASLEAPNGPGDERSLGEKLADENQSVDEKLGDEEVLDLIKSKLKDFAATLEGEREKVIFRDRLTSEEPRSLQSIGDEFGLTRERMRQIESRLLDKMREWFRKEIPDFRLLEINPPPEKEPEEEAEKSAISSLHKSAKASTTSTTVKAPKTSKSLTAHSTVANILAATSLDSPSSNKSIAARKANREDAFPTPKSKSQNHPRPKVKK